MDSSTPGITTPSSTDGANPSTPAPNPLLLRKPRRARLTRDERIRIRTLRDVGWSYQAIVDKYGFTHSGIQYACTHSENPGKHTGRPPMLSEEQVEALVAFVTASKNNRRLTYARILAAMGFDCGVDSIRYALQRRGFTNCPARVRAPVLGKNG